jgi:hypothetical protein
MTFSEIVSARALIANKVAARTANVVCRSPASSAADLRRFLQRVEWGCAGWPAAYLVLVQHAPDSGLRPVHELGDFAQGPAGAVLGKHDCLQTGAKLRVLAVPGAGELRQRAPLWPRRMRSMFLSLVDGRV